MNERSSESHDNIFHLFVRKRERQRERDRERERDKQTDRQT